MFFRSEQFTLLCFAAVNTFNLQAGPMNSTNQLPLWDYGQAGCLYFFKSSTDLFNWVGGQHQHAFQQFLNPYLVAHDQLAKNVLPRSL